MSDEVPTSTELVKAAAEGVASGGIAALIEPVSSFLAALLGPATTELGAWAGDVVAFQSANSGMPTSASHRSTYRPSTMRRSSRRSTTELHP
jgi:hypothetical protein